MKLILAIILPEDVDKVTKALVANGFRGPTRINTVGGFLRRGNVTLMLAVEAERLDAALGLIRANVQARDVTGDQSSARFRGAAFVVNIEQFLQA